MSRATPVLDRVARPGRAEGGAKSVAYPSAFKPAHSNVGVDQARQKGRASPSRRAAGVAGSLGFRRDLAIAARRDGLALPFWRDVPLRGNTLHAFKCFAIAPSASA